MARRARTVIRLSKYKRNRILSFLRVFDAPDFHGTMGQDGNAWEWEEGPFILDGDPTGQRAFRMHEGSPLTTRRASVGGPEPGFRVVSLLTQRDPFGDFNEDGSFTDADIDFLAESIRLGSIDQAIDLNAMVSQMTLTVRSGWTNRQHCIW